MKRLSASQFKRKCLKILENLGPEGLVITKNGKPLAHIAPIMCNCADLVGSMKGKIKIHGNLFSAGSNAEPTTR